ncbi:MAG: hypothetical protein F4Y24_06260 [Gemmatimonadetes bacterium]|nr:hypothetical protein [Gemmatimonadota bacterium]MYG22740.1 hypothetical protein [Gemmatimonadota bacterium]MYJ39059.1 hypothetical protein [Gemmatimonadota bacterium]
MSEGRSLSAEEIRQIVCKEQNQFRHEVIGRLGDMNAKIDKLLHHIPGIRDRVVEINARLDGVEGDTRDTKEDIARRTSGDEVRRPGRW